MAEFKTTIQGYTVELETYTEGGEPRSDCTVSKKVNYNTYSGSLALLDDLGELYDHTDKSITVDPAIVKKIMTWAIANGY